MMQIKQPRISQKYRETVKLYEFFAHNNKHLVDFSEAMMLELFVYESTGKGSISSDNGFAYGKQQMDITVAMWMEDIPKGLLHPSELYEDGNFPHRWLDRIIRK